MTLRQESVRKISRSGWLQAIGAVCVSLAQVLFHFHRPYPPPPRFAMDPWLRVSLPLFLAGLVLFAAGVPSLSRSTDPEPQRRPWLHAALVLLVLVLAFFARAYHVTEMPPPLHDDEGNVALDAMRYLNGQFPSFWMTGWYQTPVPYSALNAASLWLFGPTVLGARATGVLFSSLTVLVVYFIGRSLADARTGLLIMVAFAFQRWHLTMSRWGFCEVVLPFFACLSFLFLIRGYDLALGSRGALGSDRGSRTRLFSVAFAGFFLGLCMYIYLVSRLVAVQVGLFLLYTIAWAFVAGRHAGRARGLALRAAGAAFTCGAVYVAVFAPLAAQYVRKPQLFTARWQDISLPGKMGLTAPGASWSTIDWNPLVVNATSYPLMLNYSSNEVARHGIPYEPLLNVISGTLFALGIAALARHFWRPVNSFCLLWITVPLLGGAITVSEAPSPFRTIVASPCVAVVMLVPFYYLQLAVARRGDESGARLARRWAVVGAIAVVTSAIWNLYLYWGVHRAVPALYRHYHHTEYLVAKRVAEIDRSGPIFLEPHYATWSTVKLFNWQRKGFGEFFPSRHVPLFYPEDVDVSVFLNLRSSNVASLLHLFYPSSEVTLHRTPHIPEDGFFEVVIPAGALREARGLWSRVDASAPQRVTSFVPPPGARLPGLVTWSTDLDVPYLARTTPEYQFLVRSSAPLGDRFQLVVGGHTVRDSGVTVPLIVGRVPLELDVRDLGRDERVEILWRRAGQEWKAIPLERMYALSRPEGFGLRGFYYRGSEPQGEPLAERIDWIPTAPSAEEISSPFVIRWTGLLSVPRDGRYGMEVVSQDGSRVFLDGKRMLDSWDRKGIGSAMNWVDLRKGSYPLEIEYRSIEGARRFEFHLLGPGVTGVPPAGYLTPTPAHREGLPRYRG